MGSSERSSSSRASRRRWGRWKRVWNGLYSGFQDDGGAKTEMNQILHKNGIKEVIVYGLATDYCKRRTQGALNVVDITFANTGTAAYAGGDPVSVRSERAPCLLATAATHGVVTMLVVTSGCWAPDRDKVYSSKMELSGSILEVSGCVFGICRAQTWTRVN